VNLPSNFVYVFHVLFSLPHVFPSIIVALWLTQPLTEMSTGIFLGVKDGWLARKADNLTAICEPIV
jgi:hypothetical protein